MRVNLRGADVLVPEDGGGDRDVAPFVDELPGQSLDRLTPFGIFPDRISWNRFSHSISSSLAPKPSRPC